VLKEECSELLRGFFAEKRKLAEDPAK